MMNETITGADALRAFRSLESRTASVARQRTLGLIETPIDKAPIVGPFAWIGHMCAAIVMNDRKRVEPTAARRSASMIDRTFARNDRTHAENMRQARSVAQRPTASRMIERSVPTAAPIVSLTSAERKMEDCRAHRGNVEMMNALRFLAYNLDTDLPEDC